MTVCIDCKKDLLIPRDTVCQSCIQKWYLEQKNIALGLGGSGGFSPRVEGSEFEPESISAPRSGHAHLGHSAAESGGGDDPIEQTPRVRARACLYFRPANVTFSVGEQE